MHRIARPLLLCLVLSVLLGACGFHPAGSRPLPDVLRRVYVDVVVPYRVSEPPLEASLRARLTRQGALVTKEAASATATIKLTNLKEGRQVLSVGPDGKAIEFLREGTKLDPLAYRLHWAQAAPVQPSVARCVAL